MLRTGRIVPLMRKDSLELTDDDRAVIRQACVEAPESQMIITHGTDTMATTAECLRGVEGKTIVLTGRIFEAGKVVKNLETRRFEARG